MNMAAFRLIIGFLVLATAAPGGDLETTIRRMPDDQKIAQLLLVGYSGQVNGDELRMLCASWRVGGIVLYAHNIESPEQVRRLTESISRDAAGGPRPFIAIDQEGGMVHRLGRGSVVIPSAMAIGATRSAELARRAGLAVGTSLRDLGLTMNFAPVLDVLSEPRNTAIGTRAFGDDPGLVGTLGTAFIEGEQEAGIVAVAKHFPGEGAAAADPHATLPRIAASIDELRRHDLLPFREAFAHGLKAVMTAHVALPAITGGERPATLSRTVMTDILRSEMHFDGIAITDALQMDALGRDRDPGALALEAINAGADMVLALGGERDRRRVHDALLAAYHDGRLPRSRVDQALRRVLRVKERIAQATGTRIADSSRNDIAAEIARNAVTLTGSPNVLPVGGDERLLYVGPAGELQTALHPASSIIVSSKPAGVAVAGEDVSRDRSFRLCVAAAANEAEFEAIQRIHAKLGDIPTVFVNLGSPFRDIRCARCSTILTYADDADSQRTAADVIFGRAPAHGALPVSTSQ